MITQKISSKLQNILRNALKAIPIILLTFEPIMAQIDTLNDYAAEPQNITRLFLLQKLDINWGMPDSLEKEMHDGIKCISDKNFQKAISKFDLIINSNPTVIPAYYYRGLCYHYLKKLTKSKEDQQFVTKSLPFQPYVYVRLWNDYAVNKGAISVNSNFYMTGNYYERILEIQNLMHYLSSKGDNLNPEAFSFLKKSFSFMWNGKMNKSLDLAQEAQNLEPSACVFYLKAVVFQIMTNNDSAFFYYRKTAEIDENIIDVHKNLAVFKSLTRDRIGAYNHLSRMAKLQPESILISRFSGLLKVDLQDYYGALIDLSKYLKVDTTDFICLKQRAIARFEVKDYYGSLDDLNKIIKHNDKDLDLFLYKSENYFQLHDTITSIKILRDAEKIFSFNHSLDLRLAGKLVEINEIREAQKILDRVVAVVTLNGFNEQFLRTANVIQCKLYIKKGDTEKALQMLGSLIKKEVENSDYLFLRAKIFLVNGEIELAKNDLVILKRNNFGPSQELCAKLGI
jgi:tetratricopeptide (TPR) repeat protein